MVSLESLRSGNQVLPVIFGSPAATNAQLANHDAAHTGPVNPSRHPSSPRCKAPEPMGVALYLQEPLECRTHWVGEALFVTGGTGGAALRVGSGAAD